MHFSSYFHCIDTNCDLQNTKNNLWSRWRSVICRVDYNFLSQLSLRILCCPEKGHSRRWRGRVHFIFPFRHNFDLAFRSDTPVYSITPLPLLLFGVFLPTLEFITHYERLHFFLYDESASQCVRACKWHLYMQIHVCTDCVTSK